MSYDFRPELESIERVISGLEDRLASADSEYEREKEVLERRHRVNKEHLNGTLASLRSARDNLLRGSQPGDDPGKSEDEMKSGVPSSVEVNDGLKSNLNGSFSIRHEIKNLFPELDPWRDVLQGEITSTLQNRFPQHSESIKAATVSSALRRLANAGDLVLVSKGSGSEPNRYRLPGYEDENGNQEELSELKE